ncbi:MAG: phytanoyl-CoA dioxygenase family protein, partial [Eudoraea sp.]
MAAIKDLAEVHELISELFEYPKTIEEWEQYKLSDEQVAHFHEFGYISGIKLLDDSQIEVLRKELEEITHPNHPGHDLFYEFHSNESEDSNSVLFHSLGHWRITKGFHDVL